MSELKNVTKKSLKRCPECSKRLTILDITCRCGIKHCPAHSLPEYHNCKYDLVSEKKEILSNNLICMESTKLDCKI